MIHDLSDHGRIILNDGFVFLTGYCMHLRVEQTRLRSLQFTKFIFSIKATKLDKIFTVDLTLCSKCEIDGKDFVIFVVFLENMNFDKNHNK